MQSLTRNQQPPTGKTARTETFERNCGEKLMHSSFFVVVALDVADMSLLHWLEPCHWHFHLRSHCVAFFLSLHILILFIRIICFNECPWATFVDPPRPKRKFQGWSKTHKQFLYSESRKVRNERLKDKYFIFNNIFKIFW